MRPLRSLPAALLGALLIGSCNTEPEPTETQVGPEPAAAAPEPILRRLTTEQYVRTVQNALSDALVMPAQLEPDSERDGLQAIGAGLNAISPLGIEQYEGAAIDLAEQAMDPGFVRDGLVPCAPQGVSDDACARTVLADIGRRAWRRSLTTEELDAVVAIAGESAVVLDDFYDGLEMGLVYLLQSPNFIYRVELGEADPDQTGLIRYTSVELASRLSYFLWNGPPDEALLEAGEAGDLLDESRLAEEVDRMLADPRARDGLRALVTDMLRLYQLDTLSKDPTVFPAMSSSIGASAREETLLAVEALVFDRDEDFRNWMTTRETYLDRNLAMLYQVPAPDRDGFGPTTLPSDQLRMGLLGQVSILAAYAHPVSTSATLRGKFVREVLLCQSVPPPPADVDTSIPEPSEDAPTRRERVEAHLENAFCAGCHNLTDPIGLALENFDGLGIYRTHENGALIDASGELDGVPYPNAVGLAEAIRTNPSFTPCMTDTVYSVAAGHRPELDETTAVDWLHQRFAEDGFKMTALMRQVALSRLFRTAKEVQ